jgi:hypothetical protein
MKPADLNLLQDIAAGRVVELPYEPSIAYTDMMYSICVMYHYGVIMCDYYASGVWASTVTDAPPIWVATRARAFKLTEKGRAVLAAHQLENMK